MGGFRWTACTSAEPVKVTRIPSESRRVIDTVQKDGLRPCDDRHNDLQDYENRTSCDGDTECGFFVFLFTPARMHNVSSPLAKWNQVHGRVVRSEGRLHYYNHLRSLLRGWQMRLDAVSAGFVKRITAVNISMKILFCDRIKGDIRFFIECM